MNAPKVTLAEIEAQIVSENYFTAGHAMEQSACYRIGHDQSMLRDDPHTSLYLLTFCVLILRNGFTVTGESACAHPDNFDAEIGRKVARQHAVDKVWPLLGYELRTKIAEGEA